MTVTLYVESKLDGKSYCKSNGRFGLHLKQYGISLKEYYETYISGVTPLCYCLKPTTFYKNETYAKSCGSVKCVGKTVSNTKQNLSDEAKGVASTNYKNAQLAKSTEKKAAERAKAKQTYFKKFGVEWSTATTQKTKSQTTKLEKYGDSSFNNSSASAEKNRNKTIVEQNEINQKRRTTNLAVHGVENTFLKPTNSAKVNKGNASIKNYVFPSGKEIGVRGYEPAALDILIKTHRYTESAIIVHNDYTTFAIEVFTYTNNNNHISKYYPDIFIPAENKIIEVKSQWWWDGNGDEKYASRLSNNLKKRQAVLAKGYVYELWLFENNYTYKVLTHDTDF